MPKRYWLCIALLALAALAAAGPILSTAGHLHCKLLAATTAEITLGTDGSVRGQCVLRKSRKAGRHRDADRHGHRDH